MNKFFEKFFVTKIAKEREKKEKNPANFCQSPANFCQSPPKNSSAKKILRKKRKLFLTLHIVVVAIKRSCF